MSVKQGFTSIAFPAFGTGELKHFYKYFAYDKICKDL